jgi:hypothetical protein
MPSNRISHNTGKGLHSKRTPGFTRRSRDFGLHVQTRQFPETSRDPVPDTAEPGNPLAYQTCLRDNNGVLAHHRLGELSCNPLHSEPVLCFMIIHSEHPSLRK